MLLRALQRLLKLAPGPARAVWGAFPKQLRDLVAPHVYPIALGSRSSGLRLSVPKGGACRRVDLVARAPVDAALQQSARTLSGRLIVVDEDDDLRARARASQIVDAVVVDPSPSSEAIVQKLAWRVTSSARLVNEGAASVKSAFPSVTTIVVTYDNRLLCHDCLSSVQRNTPWPGHELIVIDNGSQDGTGAMLDALCRDGWPLRVVNNERNVGFAAATNQGLRLATTDFVVLLNDDTVVAPGWLGRLVVRLESDRKLGLVGPVTNEIGNEAKIPTAYETLEQMEAFAIRRAFEYAGRTRRARMLALFCAAARRSVLEEAELLDERFRIGLFEDDDLARKLEGLGYRLAIAEDAFVHHVGQASFGRLSDTAYLRLWQQNRRRFEKKWSTRWTPPDASDC